MANLWRLIDADALTGKCHQICEVEWNKRASPNSWTDAYESFIEDIEEAPTVDAVPVVHGRWIKDGDYVVCSECGEDHAWDEYRATYCEDCGAKMDGGLDDGNL